MFFLQAKWYFGVEGSHGHWPAHGLLGASDETEAL